LAAKRGKVRRVKQGHGVKLKFSSGRKSPFPPRTNLVQNMNPEKEE